MKSETSSSSGEERVIAYARWNRRGFGKSLGLLSVAHCFVIGEYVHLSLQVEEDRFVGSGTLAVRSPEDEHRKDLVQALRDALAELQAAFPSTSDTTPSRGFLEGISARCAVALVRFFVTWRYSWRYSGRRHRAPDADLNEIFARLQEVLKFPGHTLGDSQTKNFDAAVH
jgi:hypothetical protein